MILLGKMIGRELKYEDESVILSDNGTDKDASAELIVYATQKAVDYFNKTLPTFKLKCLKQQFLDNRENILNAYMTDVIDTFNNENK